MKSYKKAIDTLYLLDWNSYMHSAQLNQVPSHLVPQPFDSQES